jgi:hypothetical protein
MSRGCFVGVRFNGVTLSYDIDSIRQADIVSGRIVWRLIKRELGTSTTISAQIILPWNDRTSDARSQLTARLRRFLGKAREGNDIHAPFRVTTHRGHTVQTFQSLELAFEAAEALGADYYVIDRHGLQIWNQQRKLLRNEE